MSPRTTFLSIALALGTLGASVAPTVVLARTYVDIEVAPPAPRHEEIPGPRAGFVWAPGYWDYRDHNHVWVGGRWMAERHGHHWVAEHWEDHHGRWHFEPGHWERN